MFNAQILGWHAQDKYSEVYNGEPSYQYALNNPVRFLDKNSNFIVVDKDRKIIATSTYHRPVSGGNFEMFIFPVCM